eukprot:TRINITY_DN39269_c0_g1_i1.p1 TRINITY_DN39269_c0_g1~~TRINITY_DN39269_c0_g1_i1.p1  ORF type:complete len:511 (-),score=60.67 TRINITY_DN39269_c0_g1_i1:227-1759(-)
MQVFRIAGDGSAAMKDGPLPEAHFNRPSGIAVDFNGNIFITDLFNHRVRMIGSDGLVRTIAGSGSNAFHDGVGAQAHFNRPHGVTVDRTGNVYVADMMNHRIRKIRSDGSVSTLAGNGSHAYADGDGKDAHFNQPSGVAMDTDGNVIVADTMNHRIRKITPDGHTTTLAGTGHAGFHDGRGPEALFNQPSAVVVDCVGNIYVADECNHRIRKLGTDGVVSTLAGSVKGFADGQGSKAQFLEPCGVAADGDGNVIVADSYNHRIRKISPTGLVTTLAGTGQEGLVDGPAAQARFKHVMGVTVDGEGNIFVADGENHCIRKIMARLLPPKQGLPQLPSLLIPQMTTLLDDPTHADVVFAVGNQTISAHRVILAARCPYLQNMLANSPGDKEPIRIEDTTPSAFKGILRYLYTDDLHFPDEDLIDIMRKARTMSLERVYNYAVTRLRRDITTDNVTVWLIKADEYGLQELKTATFSFMSRHLRQLKKDEHFLQLLTGDSKLSKDCLRVVLDCI